MLLILCFTAAVCGLIELVYRYIYWWVRSVKVVEWPVPFFGNFFSNLYLKKHYTEIISKWYNKYKNDRYVGFYGFVKPFLLITDPKLSKVILIDNFNRFSDRGYPDISQVDPLAFNLITSHGSNWKYQREIIQPIMNSAKLKPIIPMWETTCNKLIDSILKESQQNGSVNMESSIIENLTEIFVTTCLGITYESYLNNPTLKEIIEEITYPTKMQNVRTLFSQIFPGLLKLLRWSRLSESKVEYLKEFYSELVKVKRSAAPDQKDLFMALADAHEEEKIKNNFKDSKTLMVANAQVMFSAGIDSVHTTLTLIFYELAKNQDIQEKLYNEIKRTLEKHGTISYESLNDMEYLEAVVKETLRMYPPFPFTLRRCQSDFTVPDSGGLVLRQGDVVILPIQSFHYDPQYYHEPYVFQPDRFYRTSYDNFKNVYMPFGKGPRNCVAYNFARLQMKLMVALMVLNLKFELGEKSPDILMFKHYVFSRKLAVKLLLYPKIRS